jgi:hypothetical protein
MALSSLNTSHRDGLRTLLLARSHPLVTAGRRALEHAGGT